MGILDRYLFKKERTLPKKIEIDNTLYEKLEYLSKNVYDASVNKIVNIAIMGLIETEDIKIFKKPENEIAVSHSFLIRESLYYDLEDLRDKYGISLYRLVNIAIKNALDEI